MANSMRLVANNGHPGARTGVTPEWPPDREYDEDTFRFFLSVERARAGRSKRLLRLLVATLEPVPGKPVVIPAATAARLFEGLRLSLRETDVIGWYHEHQAAGAVLSERGDASSSDVSRVIQRRIGEGLRQRLPSKIARSLQVKVFPVEPERAATR